MGRPVEFNTVLALRAHNASDEFSENQCIPDEAAIVQGSQHEFFKWGYRVLEVGKAIPLVVTEGDQKFTRVVGLAIVTRLTVEMVPNNDAFSYAADVATRGSYTIADMFSFEESEAWLKFLSPSHPPVLL